MRLSRFKVTNYRSLRSVDLDLGSVSIFVGTNGAGKSNLYKALQLLHAAAIGRFAHDIASEGGMSSALWSGTRRKGVPVRISLFAELVDEQSGVIWRYEIEAGLKPPEAAGFLFEPQIKKELLTADTGRRPATIFERQATALVYRGTDGRMTEYPASLLPSETGLAALGTSGLHGEAAFVRDTLAGWRFYHGFRSDPASPLRSPCLAVTSPLLDMDGSNMAAVFATLTHIRGDTVDLDRAIADAFPGAVLDIPVPDTHARFALSLPEFPQRTFGPEELSDGQIRFLALSAALLAYRTPPFIALNEPEASLHPRMLPALADMIARAATDAQIWVVTHSAELGELITARCGTRALHVSRGLDGATVVGRHPVAGDDDPAD